MPGNASHTSKEPPVRETLLYARVSIYISPRMCDFIINTSSDSIINTTTILVLMWKRLVLLSFHPLALKRCVFTAFLQRQLCKRSWWLTLEQVLQRYETNIQAFLSDVAVFR